MKVEVVTGEKRDRLYAKQTSIMPQFVGDAQKASRAIPVVALSRA